MLAKSYVKSRYLSDEFLSHDDLGFNIFNLSGFVKQNVFLNGK